MFSYSFLIIVRETQFILKLHLYITDEVESFSYIKFPYIFEYIFVYLLTALGLSGYSFPNTLIN